MAKNTLFLKKKPSTTSKVVLFSMVRNEIYFLPHLLAHYRKLGITEFWFLDDRSDDGTREFIMTQPDCGVIESELTFGDKVNGRPFGAAVKSIVPRALFMNRWVLTVDADEFLVLPPPFETVAQLADALKANGLPVARALMMDFFPPKLHGIEQAPMDTDPFELCPLFDPWRQMIWPDGEDNVTTISVIDAIRPRMMERLQDIGADLGNLAGTYRYANVNKAPLFYWEKDAHALSSHRVSVNPSDRVQLVLAHFKFYPGHERRIADAVSTNVHWRNSSEYRFLEVAIRELQEWPMKGPVTRTYRSRQDLVDTGLLYSRLDV